MTTEQPEALRLAAELDDGYPLTGDAISAAAELRRQHARITELEAQLSQRFDAADMATAAAQGFRDGVASVSAGSEPEAWWEHIEQRLLAWRQSFVNRSGDQLALDDFMDKQSLDDLIDFVCDEWALSTHPSPPEGMVAAKEQQAGPVGDIDAIALARYKVAPSHDSMFHRFAVVAGDGKQQLYLGREVECENMARKFAGAFLDGAFYQSQIAAAPTPAQPAPATQQPEGDVVAYLDVGANGYLDLGSELSEDALQQLPKGRHALVIAGTYGIDGYVAAIQPSHALRASHGQAPAGETLGPDAIYELIHGFGHTTHAQSMEMALGIADISPPSTTTQPAPQQAAPPPQTPFDTCPTCEALARTVMMDQTGAA